MCFEVLGFDIFFDENVKPWLIEVNALASFGTDSPLDKRIKFDLLYETIAMLKLNPKRKAKLKREKTEHMNRRQQREHLPGKEEKRMMKSKLQEKRDEWD